MDDRRIAPGPTATGSALDTIRNREAVGAVTNTPKTNTLDEDPPYEIVDTCAAVTELIDRLEELPTSPPSLYVDLEGVNLSRHGTISILQLLILPERRVYLVDVYALQGKAFSTTGTHGDTLGTILEADAVPKVFFDVRNDSNALYFHFHIHVGGVRDLQLMELATRDYSRKFVKGLSKCMETDLVMNPNEKREWMALKEKGLNLFDPRRGGSYEVFNSRPLLEDIALYCAQDVNFMPQLWSHYSAKLSLQWSRKVAMATEERIAMSQDEGYIHTGPHKSFGPKGWY